MNRSHLGHRVLWAFLASILLCGLLFTALNLLFVYTTEDSFFQRQLELEVQRQQTLPAPSPPPYPYLRVYVDSATFPPDLASQFRPDVMRAEYTGQEGRHYHLQGFMHSAFPRPIYVVAEASQELVVRPTLNRMLVVYGVVFSLVLVFALVVARHLARRVHAPLKKLVTIVEQDTIPVGFAREFEDQELYLLADKLEQSLLRLQHFAEREKNFSRDVSHELRTPLAVIQTSCELLLMTAFDEINSQRLRQIRDASQQMHELIESMLLLAREESSHEASTPLLKPLLLELWGQQKNWQNRADLTLILEMPDDAEFAASPIYLRILLNNLLQNAVAHSGAGQVHIRLVGDRLQISNPLSKNVMIRTGRRGFGRAIAQRLADQCAVSISYCDDENDWYVAITSLTSRK